MTAPLVTAAFTVYNAEASIVTALKSAVAQDWPVLEILVVDDASNDGTVSTVEAFIHEHSRAMWSIRLVRQPQNGGVARARNRLLEEARGEFVAFFDDDALSMRDVHIGSSAVRIAGTGLLVPLFGLWGAVASTLLYRIATNILVRMSIAKRHLVASE